MEQYSYKGFFQKLFHSHQPAGRFVGTTQEEFENWRGPFRELLRGTLGLDKLEQICEDSRLNGVKKGESVECMESVREEGYVRHKYVLETLPGVKMPFYMLVPDQLGNGEKRKAMIAIPAHGANKESVAGVTQLAEVRDKLARAPKENYGQEFARRGYIVFCPDPPGYGERLETLPNEDKAFMPGIKPNLLGSSCKNLAITAEAFGLSFAGLVVWDMMKLVDFVSGQLNVDMEKLGCAGFSGGGLYTLWLAALDERIRLSIISGYIHGYYDSILDTHLCPCNYVPNLWRMADICDIAALIAPRYLLIENGTQDVLNGPRGILDPREQYEKIKEGYTLLGKSDHIDFQPFEGPHMWWGHGYEFAERIWRL
jgi:hypothetical protein